MSVAVSVIVTTYNRPDALAAVLRALGRQSAIPDFEVVVADDGSRAETGQLVADLALKLPYGLMHVWQEDLGFRAARARNLAVAASGGDYLIFLDGDCVPFPDFVEQHLRLAQSGWFVSGNRVMMTESFTAKVLNQGVVVEAWGLSQWISPRLRGDIRRVLPLVRVPMPGMRRIGKRRWYGAKTCNLAMYRTDFMNVDGFDELFAGWGHEDADLVVRLIASGVFRKSGRFAVPVLHLWHPEQDRTSERANRDRLEQVLSARSVCAARGISAHAHGRCQP